MKTDREYESTPGAGKPDGAGPADVSSETAASKLLRMMIVDDERIVREAVAVCMDWGREGVSVVKSASNALEALRYLEMEPVDLMLVDIRLPVMDGLELIRQVREKYPEISIIVLSGYAEFQYAQKAIRLGVSDYLLKPIEEEALRSAVKRCVEERQRQNAETARPDSGRKVHSSSRYSATVTQILLIVDEEIGNEDLSLKWISRNKMFLNENYLSKVFQKETGGKFSAYLTNKRMERAKQIMRLHPEQQIQNIAEQCGYGHNPQYFSSAFKKHTGCTPSEYRKQIAGERE